MTIMSEDGKVFVDVGNIEYWNCFYSTIITNLKNYINDNSLVMSFIKNGSCEHSDCLSIARELNLIKDKLSMLPPDQIVYDYNDLSKEPPWGSSISSIVTSCGNFFTTSDGRDLISEINIVLCYSSVKKVRVIMQ